MGTTIGDSCSRAFMVSSCGTHAPRVRFCRRKMKRGQAGRSSFFELHLHTAEPHDVGRYTRRIILQAETHLGVIMGSRDCEEFL